jgi:hypothetical protein
MSLILLLQIFKVFNSMHLSAIKSNPSSIISEANNHNTTDEDGDSNRNDDDEEEEEGGDEINAQL